jgi:anion transporter
MRPDGAGAGLWAASDLELSRAADQRRGPRRVRRLRWVVEAVPCLALIAVLAAAVLLPAGLSAEGRITLFAFGVAVILWTATGLNSAYVALGAVLLLVLSGAAPQEKLFDSLASDVVWLMIGAFVLGAAIQASGLAARLTRFVAARARRVGQVFWLTTTALLPLSFLVPSTSGRAAVVLPVLRSLSDAAGDARVTRALALLMPVVILVSTIATLIGAGSHLVANDLLERITGRRIGFAEWVAYGLPFAIAASYLSCFVVLRLFLDGELRRRPLSVPSAPARRFSRAEWTTLGVTAGMVALWLSETLHGLETATVAVLGAAILTAPMTGVIGWKDGLKAVSWNLIVFVGAALVLGQALIETGAAEWVIARLFEVAGLARGSPTGLVLLALGLLTLTSHAYMTSHTARAAALVPPLLYLADALELNPVAVMFIGTAGMNYCLTFPVSSKALLMFQELDRETWRPPDLLLLSAVLLPLHVLLIVAFYYGWWQWVGLAL